MRSSTPASARAVRLFVATSCSLVVAAFDAAAITFDDGLTHVIDSANSYPLESVTVLDGAAASTTTVDVVSGGEVGTEVSGRIEAFGSSLVQITGGAIGKDIIHATGSSVIARDSSEILVSGGELRDSLVTTDNSTAIVSGGTILSVATSGTSEVTLSDGLIQEFASANQQSTLRIDGATVTGDVFVNDEPLVIVSDGSIDGVIVGGTQSGAPARIKVSGGTVGGIDLINSSVQISGGLIEVSLLLDGSQADILGGAIMGMIQTSGTTEMQIFGGQLGGSLLALESSAVEIFGSGFNFPLGDLTATEGTLTGILADGTPLNVGFGRASTATITLVPEPSPALLVSLGLVVLARARRRLGQSEDSTGSRSRLYRLIGSSSSRHATYPPGTEPVDLFIGGYTSISPTEGRTFVDDFNVVLTPEPTTALLVALGLLGLHRLRRGGSHVSNWSLAPSSAAMEPTLSN